MAEEKNKGTNSSGFLQAMAMTSIFGTEMAVSIVIGFYGGRWLDKQWHTEPWLMITGILLGVGAGIWSMIMTLKRFWQE